jgi:uncharacterized protein
VAAVIFNVAQLMKFPPGAARSYQVHEPFEADLGPEARAVGELRGQVKLLRTLDGVLLAGSLSLPVELSCCRCLEPFSIEVQASSEEEFRPAVDLSSGEPLPDAMEQPELLIDEQHLLDPTELIRQLILVGLPMRPVCSPECQGLCPLCGKSLNAGPCTCEDEWLDPRLAVLKQLLSEED